MTRNEAMERFEALGVYRDYPTSPGCTSPYVPNGSARWSGRQKAASP